MDDLREKLKNSKYITPKDLLSAYSLEEIIKFVNNVDEYKDDIQEDENFSENYFRLLSHILLVAYNIKQRKIPQKKEDQIRLSPQVYELLGT